MPARLRRTAKSFAAVLAAFLIYRVFLAPWVDPSFELDVPAGVSSVDLDRIRVADQQRRGKYATFFPPGSWELDQPIMLETEGVELLMKDYETLSDGRIRLSQCTMLYVSNDGRNGGSTGRVVILRAPEGAVLKFDADLNLRRGKIGRLIGGELNGPVTIHGTPSNPGADDELFIATRDIHMDQRKVWSNNRVEFRYGPSYGQGRDLTIDLLPSIGRAGKRRAPNLGGIESFKLAREVRMHLRPGSTGLFPGDRSNVKAESPLADPRTGEGEDEQLPVEIRCQGPFRFDCIGQVASFHDHVNVHQMLPEGVSDQMSCEELHVYFDNNARANASNVPAGKSNLPAISGDASNRSSLQPQRFEATGNPVIVDAPSNNVYVRANRLDYEILRRRITVEAAPQQQEAVVTWKQNEFRGRSLMVERPTETGLPLAAAVGEGRFRIAMPHDPMKLLHASWTRELKMRPAGESHQVSLVGTAHTEFPEFGNLDAEEIHLWLIELARPQSSEASAGVPEAAIEPYPVTPERMLAQRNVRFNSAQLTGDTEHLEVWFDPAGTLLPTPRLHRAGSQSLGGNLFGLGGPATAQQPSVRRGEDSSGIGESQLAGSVAAAGSNIPHGITGGPLIDEPAQESQQHFELHGNLIRAQLRSQGTQAQLDSVVIDRNVRLLETRTRQPSDRPLEIRGDWLQVLGAATEQTTVLVKGKPAQIAARGMEMSGAEIHLDRGRNELWIPGAGRTVLPARNGQHPSSGGGAPRLAGFDSLAGSPVSIDFQGGMNFNGKVARYNEQVVVRSESRTMRADHPTVPETRVRTVVTETVEVTLRRPVEFAADQADEQAEVDEIACLGGATMKQLTSDHRGRVAEETLVTRDLSIRQTSGEIHSLGPGTLESTRLSAGGSVGGWGIAARSANASAKQESPVYALVKFDREITGNLHHHQLVLHENVQGVYGPVQRWGDKLELNQPRRIGPNGICFGSDRLIVTQVYGSPPQADTVVLEAIGNTVVEGETFLARAGRLVYEQGKEQLTFYGRGPDEGDGRNDAELYYQPQSGAAQTTARAGMITYWPLTRRVDVKEAQFINLGQFAPNGFGSATGQNTGKPRANRP